MNQLLIPAKPIAVKIIDFGADPDRPTWETVAQLSGGSYPNLPPSAFPDPTTAVNYLPELRPMARLFLGPLHGPASSQS